MTPAPDGGRDADPDADRGSAAERGGATERRPSTRSAVLAGVITLVAVVVMANLGLWQLRRHGEVGEQNVRIAERTTTPVPVEEVDVTAPVEQWDFQLVEVVGRWVPHEEVLWRGRNRNLVPGFEVLTPLVTCEVDEAVAGQGCAGWLVDRGFLPDTFDEVPATAATPPDGRVRVLAVLRPTVRQPGFGARDPDDGRLEVVFHADVPRIDRQVTADLHDEAYLRLVEAQPPTTSDVLRPLAPITPDAGPHLGYALQWLGFSLTAVAAYGAWLWSRVLRPRRRS